MSSYYIPPLTPLGNITVNTSALAPGFGAVPSNAVYTVSGSNGSSGNWASVTQSQNIVFSEDASNKPAVRLDKTGIHIDGEADLTVGNISIRESLARIESRLALLSPNPNLEKEWDELKRLGDEYRALEADIKDKMKMWDILSK